MQKYRVDLDGLRALAIVAVVLYHVFPTTFHGCFVGVDIFFVVSGYLITNVLYREFHSDFGFYKFYGRRIRRIFPSLILVIATSLLIGYYVLSHQEFAQLGKHARSNALFIANFTLAEDIGFFDTGAIKKPPLHLWSLGIEEQFYIFWPLILYYSWKGRVNLALMTGIIVIISFISSIYLTFNDPKAAYYLPTGRAWQILSGCLLALSNSDYKYRSNLRSFYNKLAKIFNNYHLDVTSIVGFILVICSLLFIEKDNYPGYYALIPVLGVILLISSGPSAFVNKHILSRKILCSLATISYPLYLWHWPLISFLHIYKDGELSDSLIYYAVLISFVLSILTNKYIEQPIRLSKDKKYVPILLLLAMFIVGLIGHFIFVS